MVGNESNAIGNTRVLADALQMYNMVYMKYPTDWQDDMYTNAEPDFGPSRFNMKMSTPAGPISGYLYSYREYPANATGSDVVGFRLMIYPSNYLTTGTRTIFATEDGVIHHCVGEGASIWNASAYPTINEPPTNC